MPEISVIVPIYGVEKYLDQCVQSIVDQTFRDLEIILVEDGSPDCCPVMCDTWANKDARIKVLHKPNGGISDARNAGLAIAGGKYISFVDGDDYLKPDMLQTMYAAACTQAAPLVICGQEKVDEDGNRLSSDKTWFERDMTVDEPAFWELFAVTDNSGLVAACNKLYQTEIFDEIRYPKNMINEDYFLLPSIIERCNKIVCLHYEGYFHVQRPGSIMHSDRALIDLNQALGDIERAKYNMKKNRYDAAEGALTNVAHCLYKRGRPEKKKYKELYGKVWRQLKTTYFDLAKQKQTAPMYFRVLLLNCNVSWFVIYADLRNKQKRG